MAGLEGVRNQNPNVQVMKCLQSVESPLVCARLRGDGGQNPLDKILVTAASWELIIPSEFYVSVVFSRTSIRQRTHYIPVCFPGGLESR